MTLRSEKEKKAIRLETSLLVDSLTREIDQHLHEELKNQPGLSYWVVRGRIISLLFAWHFLAPMEKAKQVMDKVDKEKETTP